MIELTLNTIKQNVKLRIELKKIRKENKKLIKEKEKISNELEKIHDIQDNQMIELEEYLKKQYDSKRIDKLSEDNIRLQTIIRKKERK